MIYEILQVIACGLCLGIAFVSIDVYLTRKKKNQNEEETTYSL